MVPKTVRNVPVTMRERKWPRSKSGPATRLNDTSRKAWKVPIQEISEALWVWRRVVE